jgi:hypothetical protein
VGVSWDFANFQIEIGSIFVDITGSVVRPGCFCLISDKVEIV